MAVFGSFFRGWLSALNHPSLIFLKWLLNLIFAWALTAPLFEILREDLEHSGMGPALLEQLDAIYLMEFMSKYEQQIGGALAIWLPAVAALGLLNIYLNGGILDALQRDRRPGWPEFLHACGAHFLSMMIVLFATVALGACVVLLPLAILEWFSGSLIGNARISLWVHIIGFGLIILLPGSWLIRIYHFARIKVCLTPTGSEPVTRKTIGQTLRLFGSAVAFTSNRHVSTFILWLLFILAHIAIFPLVVWVQGFVATDGPWRFLQEWGVAQITILFRITAGIATLAGLLAFLRGSGARTPSSQNPVQETPAKQEEDPNATDGPGANPFRPVRPEASSHAPVADQPLGQARPNVGDEPA